MRRFMFVFRTNQAWGLWAYAEEKKQKKKKKKEEKNGGEEKTDHLVNVFAVLVSNRAIVLVVGHLRS